MQRKHPLRPGYYGHGGEGISMDMPTLAQIPSHDKIVGPQPVPICPLGILVSLCTEQNLGGGALLSLLGKSFSMLPL